MSFEIDRAGTIRKRLRKAGYQLRDVQQASRVRKAASWLHIEKPDALPRTGLYAARNSSKSMLRAMTRALAVMGTSERRGSGRFHWVIRHKAAWRI